MCAHHHDTRVAPSRLLNLTSVLSSLLLSFTIHCTLSSLGTPSLYDSRPPLAGTLLPSPRV